MAAIGVPRRYGILVPRRYAIANRGSSSAVFPGEPESIRPTLRSPFLRGFAIGISGRFAIALWYDIGLRRGVGVGDWSSGTLCERLPPEVLLQFARELRSWGLTDFWLSLGIESCPSVKFILMFAA
ncbi:MAG: hypothetical protein VKK42_11040 [Lyngbya sp.]|nr:hypothetical protein [Lyngbya sp.]